MSEFERLLQAYVDSHLGMSDDDEMAAAHLALVAAADALGVAWPEPTRYSGCHD